MKKLFFLLLLSFALANGYSQTVTPLVKSIVIQPEIRVSIIGFEINSTIDNPKDKTVISNINLIAADGLRYDRSGIVVWQGDDYDNVGQWTDTDLKNAIKAILEQ